MFVVLNTGLVLILFSAHFCGICNIPGAIPHSFWILTHLKITQLFKIGTIINALLQTRKPREGKAA